MAYRSINDYPEITKHTMNQTSYSLKTKPSNIGFIVGPMNQSTILLLLIWILHFNTQAQDFKKDMRPTNIKENKFKLFESDQISNTKLPQAMKQAGLRIHKFNIETVDKECALVFTFEEVRKGERNIHTQRSHNQYRSWN